MRKKIILLTASAAVTLAGAFAYGSHSALNNGLAFRLLNAARVAIVGESNAKGDSQEYVARRTIFEASTIDADVVFIGDSLTRNGEWAEHFPGVRLANRGIGGDTTAGILRRMDSILSVKPEKALIMTGVNDLIGSGTFSDEAVVDGVLVNYRQIIHQLRERGIKVIVQSTLYVSRPTLMAQVNPRVELLNKGLRAYCERGHCVYEELNDDLAPAGALDAELTWDGVHLNGRGYEVWIKQISPHITDVS